MRALLMVGGEGRRLRPLTNTMPKSLLKVGSYSILENILLLLRRYGVDDVTLAVNYLASMIQECFGDGDRLGLRISYQHEEKPLGTAGALALLDGFDSPIVLMNGDILTDMDFGALTSLHSATGAAMTVASKVMHTDLSLGVLDVDRDGRICGYREKPRLEHRFCIGMYVVDPLVKQYMTRGERVDIPELISRLLEGGQRVSCYEHHGKWIDIGMPEDYARVQAEAQMEQGMGVAL